MAPEPTLPPGSEVRPPLPPLPAHWWQSFLHGSADALISCKGALRAFDLIADKLGKAAGWMQTKAFAQVSCAKRSTLSSELIWHCTLCKGSGWKPRQKARSQLRQRLRVCPRRPPTSLRPRMRLRRGAGSRARTGSSAKRVPASAASAATKAAVTSSIGCPCMVHRNRFFKQ